jgi:hypothetical protein
MCCIVRLGCCCCIGIFCGAYWLVSPSFRKSLRERRADEVEKNAALERECAEMSQKIDQTFARWEQRKLERIALEVRMREKVAEDPELKRRVEFTLKYGGNEIDVIRECFEEMNKEKVRARTSELAANGMSYKNAYRVASDEINQF